MGLYLSRGLSLLCVVLLGFFGASAEVKTINIDTKKNVYVFSTSSEGTSSNPTIKKIITGSFTLTTTNSWRTESNKYLSIKKTSGTVSIQPLDDVVIEGVTLTTAGTVNAGAALTVTVETPDGRSVYKGKFSMSKKSTAVSFDIDEDCLMGGTAVTLKATTDATVTVSCIEIRYHYTGCRVLNERYEQVTDEDDVKNLSAGDRLLFVACREDGSYVAMGREESDRDLAISTYLGRVSVPVDVKDGVVTITNEPVEVVTLESAPVTSDYISDWYLCVSGRYLRVDNLQLQHSMQTSSATTRSKFRISKINTDEVKIACAIPGDNDELIKYSTNDRFGCEGGAYIKLFRKVESPAVVEVADAASLQAFADGTEVALSSQWSVAYASPDGLSLYLYDAATRRDVHTGHFVKLNLSTPYSGRAGALLPVSTAMTVGHEGDDVVLMADSVTAIEGDTSLDLDSDLATEFDTDVEALAAMPVHQYVTIRNVLINCNDIPGVGQHFEANINYNDATVPSSANTYLALRNQFGLATLPLSGTWEYDVRGFIGRPVADDDIPEPQKVKSRLQHHDTHYIDRMLYVTDIYRHDTTTSVGQLEVDAASAAEYYTLQGLRVTPGQLTPGIYIMRRDGIVSKLLVK